MPQRLRMFVASVSSRSIVGSPKTVISPASGVCSPMIDRISTDLPVPDPPTTPEDLAAADLEVEIFVDDLVAEAVHQPVDVDHDVAIRS